MTSPAQDIVNSALVAGVAAVTFAARYDAVVVENEASTAGNGIYARTDGQTPVSPWNDSYYIEPGDAETIPNDDAEWFQGQGSPSDGTMVILVTANPFPASVTSSFSVTGV
jgi:hypothetical protein